MTLQLSHTCCDVREQIINPEQIHMQGYYKYEPGLLSSVLAPYGKINAHY